MREMPTLPSARAERAAGDPAQRLLAQQAGPKLAWGPPASPADARRREANRLLEKHGLKPQRW